MDPRKPEIITSWSDAGEHLISMIPTAENTCDDLIAILDAHGITPKSANILEVGSGTWHLLHIFRNRGIKIVGIDGRPKPFREDLWIVTWRIEEMSMFDDKSFNAVVSSNVFDANYYEQEKERMLAEIGRVLWNGGMYVWKEPHELDLTITDCDKRIYENQFQVFRKDWWWIRNFVPLDREVNYEQ